MKIVNPVNISKPLKVKIYSYLNTVQRLDDNGREVVYLNGFHPTLLKLKTILQEIGVFNFYSTNSGEYVIGVSQIIYFIESGWKAYQRGITISKYTHQIHHYNGIVNDNRPDNLICLSIQDHRIVTLCQNGLLDISCYLPEVSDSIISFNKNGELIKDRLRFLQQVIAKTLILTQKWIDITAQGNSNIFNIKSILSWIYNQLTPLTNLSSLFNLSTSFFDLNLLADPLDLLCPL